LATKIRVLIADDDDGYRFPLKNLLDDYEYEVLEARNKEELIRQAQGADVWVIDARLPTEEMEGIEAVRELGERGTIPRHPVLFISVMPEDNVKVKLDSLKGKGIPYEWVEKPFELELLLRRIQAHKLP
jgi:DNA-binding response OmpR family regulator